MFSKDQVARMAGFIIPKPKPQDAIEEFMNQWREDHKKNISEPMWTGDWYAFKSKATRRS